MISISSSFSVPVEPLDADGAGIDGAKLDIGAEDYILCIGGGAIIPMAIWGCIIAGDGILVGIGGGALGIDGGAIMAIWGCIIGGDGMPSGIGGAGEAIDGADIIGIAGGGGGGGSALSKAIIPIDGAGIIGFTPGIGGGAILGAGIPHIGGGGMTPPIAIIGGDPP